MKTMTIGTVILSATLAFALLGDQGAKTANAQEKPEVVQTNQLDTTRTLAPFAGTLPDGVDPSSAYAQLIRMVQAGVDEGVILAYVKKSPRFFELNADDIIYLTNLGTPPEIIQAALERDEALFNEGVGISEPSVAEEVVETPAEPEQEVTVDYFHDFLSPYGSWVYVEGYGQCWRPTIVVYDSDWRPYLNNGCWVYTDHGWYWRSNYRWGWATFHYGRWFYHASYGWCWWPDTVWAPSWVCWRYNADYCGWAPLPPYTVYRSGVGLVYRNNSVSAGFGFGLDINHFTFIAINYICNPKPWKHCISQNDARRVYDQTSNRFDFASRQGGRIVTNPGIPLDDIPPQTRTKIRPVRLEYDDGRTHGGDDRFDAQTETLHVRRPNRTGGTETVATYRHSASPQSQRERANAQDSARRAVADQYKQDSEPAMRNHGAQQPRTDETTTPPNTHVTSKRTTPVIGPRRPGVERKPPATLQPNTQPRNVPPQSKPSETQPRSTPQDNRALVKQPKKTIQPITPRRDSAPPKAKKNIQSNEGSTSAEQE